MWKLRDNSIERAGAAPGAESSAVLRALGCLVEMVKLCAEELRSSRNSDLFYLRDAFLSQLCSLGGPLPSLWIIDLVIIL